MVGPEYLQGRSKWDRPQAVIFSDVRFLAVDGGYAPPADATEGIDFIILSDHNRSELKMTTERLGSRRRMINGTSRGHFTADKATLSTSWDGLPGRVSEYRTVFDQTGQQISPGQNYVVDAGAGALDLIQWHEKHIGEFYVLLSYDNGATQRRYIDQRLMYFESFDHTLMKRGRYDFWNISMDLGEI